MAKKILCDPIIGRDAYAILETNKLTGMSTWYGPLYQTYQQAAYVVKQLRDCYEDARPAMTNGGKTLLTSYNDGVADMQLSLGKETLRYMSYEVVKRLIL